MTEKTGPDYSATLYLPRTDFPMRAGLPEKGAGAAGALGGNRPHRKNARVGAGKPKFVLHDGPPYANGNIHIGHALNKILKDSVVRSQRMMGKEAHYVPGWDCHGLPIEWKIEEQYRAKGRNKDEVPVVEFRQECRAFAKGWLDVQREEFIRLGVAGDWAGRYATMDFPAESIIAREIMKFAANGLLYRGSKPVMWSVVEKTALAEAEVEYEDHTSDWVFVAFPDPAVQDAKVVIWTTTPWTLPGNRAISFSHRIAYGLYRVTAAPEGNWAKAGEQLLFWPTSSPKSVMQSAKVEAFERRPRRARRANCAAMTAAHPLEKLGYDFEVPCSTATMSPTTPAPASSIPRRAMAARISTSGWRRAACCTSAASTRAFPIRSTPTDFTPTRSPALTARASSTTRATRATPIARVIKALIEARRPAGARADEASVSA